jgi:hypothetical protein
MNRADATCTQLTSIAVQQKWKSYTRLINTGRNPLSLTAGRSLQHMHSNPARLDERSSDLIGWNERGRRLRGKLCQ